MAVSESTKGEVMAIELATLALAKAIFESDAKAARAALNSGADQEAFWMAPRCFVWKETGSTCQFFRGGRSGQGCPQGTRRAWP